MKKYTAVYEKIKEMIFSKQFKSGDKIPSVRKAANLFGVSTTTVQNAYFDLCADGYIIAAEKSGYYTADVKSVNESTDKAIVKSSVKYDLTGGIADPQSFDFTLWQRYIKSALRQKKRLLSYSDSAGEYDLRNAISAYIREKRNVIAPPEQIVIGAGVGPLLQILSSLLDDRSTISFPDSSFEQGIGIFSDNGYNVTTRNKDAQIIYVCPSHMTRWGDVMPIKRRLELIEYSTEHDSLVIEDDYENEFLYNVKPTPSLFALGKGNIVYLGSFSAMLLPGIRISFMVLTKELAKEFEKKASRFSQTASKTEQIALCQYIRDGRINSQTRKIRRLYSAKTKEFARLLKKDIENAELEIGENTLQIILKCPFNKSVSVFEENELSVFVQSLKNGLITLVISPSSIPQEELENASKALKKAISF